MDKQMKKTNKQRLLEKLDKVGCVLGCWDNKIELLTDYSLRKVLAVVDEEHTDVKVSINRKPYVVEIATVDNEKDFSVLSKAEYINRYGSEFFED